jgi:hypothetical protein
MVLFVCFAYCYTLKPMPWSTINPFRQIVNSITYLAKLHQSLNSIERSTVERSQHNSALWLEERVVWGVNVYLRQLQLSVTVVWICLLLVPSPAAQWIRLSASLHAALILAVSWPRGNVEMQPWVYMAWSFKVLWSRGVKSSWFLTSWLRYF